jgi:hypothetical protein
MFPSTTEQFYLGYQDNSTLTFNYSTYSTNDYNCEIVFFKFLSILYLFLVSNDQTQSSLIIPHEQIIPTNKIYFNPFFKPRSLNPINELSPLKNRSRSPSSDRKVIISSGNKLKRRQIRKEQREKLIQEKELLSKKQSALILKHKRRRSSPDRWEHKVDKLKLLYTEYSSEDIYKQWKPLILKECFELYQYAFDKSNE